MDTGKDEDGTPHNPQKKHSIIKMVSGYFYKNST